MPVSELRKWSFDNGTAAVFITNQADLPFIDRLPGATVEQCSDGKKVHLIVSDSWYIAFCISHARHILRGRAGNPAYDDHRASPA